MILTAIHLLQACLILTQIPEITDFKINNNDSLTEIKNVVLTISAADDITPQNSLK